jgi:ATP-binding cassette, subfamily F, member 3
MLHINDLTFRMEGRLLFEKASAAIPAGHKVGFVGRNGAGKTTLLRLIAGELSPDDGDIRLPKDTRIGWVTQEAPGGPDSLIDVVLAADTERAALLAEAETATDPGRIAEIHVRLADIDAHSAPARASRLLSGLGFDEAAQKRPCSEYSGGWRMRVALAAMLFTEPELLLLDEPTNYLDLEGTLWLEDYLRTYPHTVLLVSHDRDLLNKAVGFILHLSQGKLTLYTGGYDRFEDARREKQRLDGKLKKKQDDERAHIESFIERFKAKATKAKQAQSRMKALARMQPIAETVEERVIPFAFPSPKRAMASPLVRFESAAAGYVPGVPVLRGLNLRLDHDDRIGLLGANGNGKSTFAKLIGGRMPVMGGQRVGSEKMTVGYFAQHQLDELPSGMTPYQHMVELMPEAPESQRRAKLGALGFGYEKADTKAENLSGGEKARLLFARATFHAPHLLILDEPTNHLDVDSREQLVRALAEYEGAVILISHDRHLIEASADRLWLVRDGTVRPYDGDMESYRAELLGEKSGPSSARNGAAGEHLAAIPELKLTPQEARRLAAERRAQFAPLKKKVAYAELQMTRLTATIARIDDSLADTGIYAKDPARAQQLTVERGQLAKALADAEEAWLAASEAYEAAMAETETVA